MTQGRVGIRPYSGSPAITYDTDAQAFITAAALTDTTQKTAINELVKDLKSAGLWTKMVAIYPMVGGTATTHKWNLKDPRDLDAAFRLKFYGGGTHGPNGYLPNKTDAYANTCINPSLVMTSSTSHASYYSRTATFNSDTEQYVIGLNYTRMSMYRYTVYGGLASPWVPQAQPYNTDNTAGFFVVNRTPSNIVSINKNGTTLNSLASGTAGFENGFIYLGAMNWGSQQLNNPQGFSNKECAFSSFGSHFTDLESNLFYQIVEKYQYNLGRNINVSKTFYYNSNYSITTNAYIIESNVTNLSTLPVTDGLVVLYDAALSTSYPGTGVSWYDLSVNSNTAILTNGPTFNSANNGSIVFDGTNDFASLASNSLLNFGSGSFTINVFFKPNSIQTGGNFPAIIEKSVGDFTYNTSVGGWILFWLGDRYTFMLGNNTTSKNSVDFSPTITNNNTWKNLSVVVSSTNIKSYYNGSINNTSTKTLTGSTDTTADLNIARWRTYTRYLNTNIGVIQIYNRELSASEILQNFNTYKSRYGL